MSINPLTPELNEMGVLCLLVCATHHVTRHNMPIHHILSTFGQE
jgi:hypothetical protein